MGVKKWLKSVKNKLNVFFHAVKIIYLQQKTSKNEKNNFFSSNGNFGGYTHIGWLQVVL
tara:strand:- start:15 stop:191 length:177 start_codon:yes stop_codon:yes gene_type:complete